MTTVTERPTTFQSARRRWAGMDWILHTAARLSGVTVLLMLAALLSVLFVAAMPSIKAFGAHFIYSTEWRPNELERPQMGPNGRPVLDSDGEVVTETVPPAFGAAPVIWGTVISSTIALVLAVPLSLGAAIFLIRVAARRLAAPVSFLIEFLAAVPSIAYGIWGLFVVVPFLQHYVEPEFIHLCTKTPLLAWLVQERAGGRVITVAATGRDMLCGGIVLAIMIVPIVTAVSRDVLKQVPRAQLEGTVALGATWWQSCTEMLLFARAGLFGAIMLGLARAAGETMAVTMVIGNNSQISFSPLAPAQTMSSLLATEFAEADQAIYRASLCEVALILLVMSLAFNVIARWLVVGKGGRAGAAF